MGDSFCFTNGDFWLLSFVSINLVPIFDRLTEIGDKQIHIGVYQEASESYVCKIHAKGVDANRRFQQSNINR